MGRLVPVMSTRKYKSVGFNFKSFIARSSFTLHVICIHEITLQYLTQDNQLIITVSKFWLVWTERERENYDYFSLATLKVKRSHGIKRTGNKTCFRERKEENSKVLFASQL